MEADAQERRGSSPIVMRLQDDGRMIARGSSRMVSTRKRVDRKVPALAYQLIIRTEGRISEGSTSCAS